MQKAVGVLNLIIGSLIVLYSINYLLSIPTTLYMYSVFDIRSPFRSNLIYIFPTILALYGFINIISGATTLNIFLAKYKVKLYKLGVIVVGFNFFIILSTAAVLLLLQYLK